MKAGYLSELFTGVAMKTTMTHPSSKTRRSRGMTPGTRVSAGNRPMKVIFVL
jgi:hypothetical protein